MQFTQEGYVVRYLVVEGGDSPTPIWRPCEELADALATAEAALNSGAEDVRVLETTALSLDVQQIHVVRLASEPVTESVLASVPDLAEPDAVEHGPDAVENGPDAVEDRDCPAAAWIDSAKAAVDAATMPEHIAIQHDEIEPAATPEVVEPVTADPVADEEDEPAEQAAVRRFATANGGPRIGSFGR
ncbi:MAG: hypothetical protein HKN26_07850 [Acidimicrobiales bacterium]|nr:hypothetical protein [Acidimicrobiales bacterium]